MIKGCYTAIITPFTEDGAIDAEGLSRLVEFQIACGITGIVAVGTTGESPTLTWEEHIEAIREIGRKTAGRCHCIAGTGSNNTQEAIEGTGHAADAGVDTVLLVDPYYNGPSSLEIREEYVAPVAKAFPGIRIIPYVIPGRTGTQLLPEDLAILYRKFGNVSAVKEATADIANMRRTRSCCGADYDIMSGDDGMTFEMMTDPEIRAGGVISVASNIAPAAVSEMVRLLETGKTEAARRVKASLEPLFDLVTVKTSEKTPYGEVVCRARNPVGTKTLMQILGMPSGKCRRPLGKLTRKGLEKVLSAARKLQAEAPEIFKPAAEFFNVDIDARLSDAKVLDTLCYDDPYGS